MKNTPNTRERVIRVPNEEEYKLTWFKWYLDDVKALREVFTEEQIGIFFLAAMDTLETGELNIDSLPQEMQIPFRIFSNKVFSARRVYAHKCEVNARNGAKGGRAKADNARKKNADDPLAPTFKPPTKTEFKNMAKHIRAEYDLDLDAYEIDRIYDDLAGSGWNYRGAQLTTKKQIEAVIYAAASNDFNSKSAVRLLLEKGYTDLEAETLDILACDYDEGREAWQLVKGGPWYSTIEEAVDAYLSEDDD